jgi:hypothetical protein
MWGRRLSTALEMNDGIGGDAVPAEGPIIRPDDSSPLMIETASTESSSGFRAMMTGHSRGVSPPGSRREPARILRHQRDNARTRQPTLVVDPALSLAGAWSVAATNTLRSTSFDMRTASSAVQTSFGFSAVLVDISRRDCPVSQNSGSCGL